MVTKWKECTRWLGNLSDLLQVEEEARRNDRPEEAGEIAGMIEDLRYCEYLLN